MANEPANNQKKWLLVGVLGVVLVGVVGWQLLPSRSAETPTKPDENSALADGEKSSPRLPRRFPAKGAPLTKTAGVTPKTWPEASLAKAIAHDPFAPESLPDTAENAAASGGDIEAAAAAEREALLAGTLEALRERGVSVVLHTANGPVATIGDRMIKVGDTVGDYRVAEIDADGVVLEPAPPK